MIIFFDQFLWKGNRPPTIHPSTTRMTAASPPHKDGPAPSPSPSPPLVSLSSSQQQQQQQFQAAKARNAQMVTQYQGQFPAVPTMTSEELVALFHSNTMTTATTKRQHHQQRRPRPVLLVDVRSHAEQCISMIPGAIAGLEDTDKTKTNRKGEDRRSRNTHHNHNNNHNNNKIAQWIQQHCVDEAASVPENDDDDNDDDDNDNDDTRNTSNTTDNSCRNTDTTVPLIVVYCTIGYRSGREAQRLIDELTTGAASSSYLIHTPGSGRTMTSAQPQPPKPMTLGTTFEIKNLDGILAYSFVAEAPPLIVPRPRRSPTTVDATTTTDDVAPIITTRKIHTYGKAWSTAVNPTYEIVYFGKKTQQIPHLVHHALQTGWMILYRRLQHHVAGWSRNKKKKTNTT